MDAAEYPKAFRLAGELASMPDLLRLRTRRLVLDLIAMRRCGKTTAWRAVGWARRLARGEAPA